MNGFWKNPLPALLLLAFALLAAGCIQPGPETPSASPFPSHAPAASPSPSVSTLPAASPSPSPAVNITIPSAVPAEVNYSQTEVVAEFWTAINDEDFTRAYSFVSREFKAEDPNASSVEAFRQRLEQEFPAGVNFSDVQVAKENPREVTFMLGAKGSANLKLRSRVVVFESGYWKIRIPYATYGLYYNNYTKFVLNAVELSRYLERASNDFFSQMDASLKSDPMEFELIDQANKVFFASKSLVVTGGGLPSGKGYDEVEIKFGPNYFVPALSSTAMLSDRQFSFEYPNGGVIQQGGYGGFFCNRGKNDLFVSVKIGSAMVQYYSGWTNPFQPVLEALSRACPP